MPYKKKPHSTSSVQVHVNDDQKDIKESPVNAIVGSAEQNPQPQADEETAGPAKVSDSDISGSDQTRPSGDASASAEASADKQSVHEGSS